MCKKGVWVISKKNLDMQVFWVNVGPDGQAWLDENETRHCQKVLRHQVGDEVHTIDGKGNYHLARILGYGQRQTQLQILETQVDWGEHGGEITLGVSPLRLKDRFEWLIEKAVELGVNAIVPLRCARTDPYKARFKPDRLHTLMIVALKQCKRSRLPQLHPLVDYRDWVATLSPTSPSFIAHCEAQAPFFPLLTDLPSPPRLHLLIGPEGDFTPEEVQLAEQRGVHSVALGYNRLRTETAALHALSLIKCAHSY